MIKAINRRIFELSKRHRGRSMTVNQNRRAAIIVPLPSNHFFVVRSRLLGPLREGRAFVLECWPAISGASEFGSTSWRMA